jgi:F0F1-type ATP synthase assembly protein I
MAPINQDDDPKLQKLDAELKAARKDFEGDYNPKPVENHSTKGANIGYEFLAYVVSGGGLGYAIDYFINSLPLFFMIGIVLGFVGGVYRANERQKNL